VLLDLMRFFVVRLLLMSAALTPSQALADEPSEPPPPLELPPPAPERGGTTGVATAGYVLSGLGVAGLLTGIITGAVALSENGKAGEGCEDGSLCAPENKQHERRALNLAHASTGSFVVGGVGLGLGVILVVLGTKSRGDTAFVTANGVGFRF
jgi:hypothetical protein